MLSKPKTNRNESLQLMNLNYLLGQKALQESGS